MTQILNVSSINLEESEALGQIIKEKENRHKELKDIARSVMKALKEYDKVCLNRASKEQATEYRATPKSLIFRKEMAGKVQEKRDQVSPPIPPRLKKGRNDAKGPFTIRPTGTGRKTEEDGPGKEGSGGDTKRTPRKL